MKEFAQHAVDIAALGDLVQLLMPVQAVGVVPKPADVALDGVVEVLGVGRGVAVLEEGVGLA